MERIPSDTCDIYTEGDMDPGSGSEVQEMDSVEDWSTVLYCTVY